VSGLRVFAVQAVRERDQKQGVFGVRQAGGAVHVRADEEVD
jgi:hypothetical protein